MNRSARYIGLLAFALFLLSIPVANWLIGNVGSVCVPNGPCLIPVAPGIMAPSGVMMVGLALVLRDIVQRTLGAKFSLLAIMIGAVISAMLAPGVLVLASTLAFLLSELVDFSVYTPLQKRGLMRAVILSTLAGLMVDSVIFLWFAFGSLDFLAGQIIGKVWGLLVALPSIRFVRRITPVSA